MQPHESSAPKSIATVAAGRSTTRMNRTPALSIHWSTGVQMCCFDVGVASCSFCAGVCVGVVFCCIVLRQSASASFSVASSSALASASYFCGAVRCVFASLLCDMQSAFTHSCETNRAALTITCAPWFETCTCAWIVNHLLVSYFSNKIP